MKNTFYSELFSRNQFRKEIEKIFEIGNFNFDEMIDFIHRVYIITSNFDDRFYAFLSEIRILVENVENFPPTFYFCTTDKKRIYYRPSLPKLGLLNKNISDEEKEMEYYFQLNPNSPFKTASSDFLVLDLQDYPDLRVPETYQEKKNHNNIVMDIYFDECQTGLCSSERKQLAWFYSHYSNKNWNNPGEIIKKIKSIVEKHHFNFCIFHKIWNCVINSTTKGFKPTQILQYCILPLFQYFEKKPDKIEFLNLYLTILQGIIKIIESDLMDTNPHMMKNPKFFQQTLLLTCSYFLKFLFQNPELMSSMGEYLFLENFKIWVHYWIRILRGGKEPILALLKFEIQYSFQKPFDEITRSLWSTAYYLENILLNNHSSWSSFRWDLQQNQFNKISEDKTLQQIHQITRTHLQALLYISSYTASLSSLHHYIDRVVQHFPVTEESIANYINKYFPLSHFSESQNYLETYFWNRKKNEIYTKHDHVIRFQQLSKVFDYYIFDAYQNLDSHLKLNFLHSINRAHQDIAYKQDFTLGYPFNEDKILRYSLIASKIQNTHKTALEIRKKIIEFDELPQKNHSSLPSEIFFFFCNKLHNTHFIPELLYPKNTPKILRRILNGWRNSIKNDNNQFTLSIKFFSDILEMKLREDLEEDEMEKNIILYNLQKDLFNKSGLNIENFFQKSSNVKNFFLHKLNDKKDRIVALLKEYEQNLMNLEQIHQQNILLKKSVHLIDYFLQKKQTGSALIIIIFLYIEKKLKPDEDILALEILYEFFFTFHSQTFISRKLNDLCKSPEQISLSTLKFIHQKIHGEMYQIISQTMEKLVLETQGEIKEKLIDFYRYLLNRKNIISPNEFSLKLQKEIGEDKLKNEILNLEKQEKENPSTHLSYALVCIKNSIDYFCCEIIQKSFSLNRELFFSKEFIPCRVVNTETHEIQGYLFFIEKVFEEKKVLLVMLIEILPIVFTLVEKEKFYIQLKNGIKNFADLLKCEKILFPYEEKLFPTDFSLKNMLLKDLNQNEKDYEIPDIFFPDKKNPVKKFYELLPSITL